MSQSSDQLGAAYRSATTWLALSAAIFAIRTLGVIGWSKNPAYADLMSFGFLAFGLPAAGFALLWWASRPGVRAPVGYGVIASIFPFLFSVYWCIDAGFPGRLMLKALIHGGLLFLIYGAWSTAQTVLRESADGQLPAEVKGGIVVSALGALAVVAGVIFQYLVFA